MSARTDEAVLETRQLSKYFGSVIAIKDISMFVRPGTVTCLLGDNGAGKSTLIKTLSGVYEPSEGDNLCDGEEIHLKSPRDALARGTLHNARVGPATLHHPGWLHQRCGGHAWPRFLSCWLSRPTFLDCRKVRPFLSQLRTCP